MSSFKALDTYSLKADMFLDFTKVYKYIGQNQTLELSLQDKVPALKAKNLELDCYLLCKKILKIDVSDARMRLLINKNNEPRNLSEAKVVSVKKELKAICQNASIDKRPINSVDILDILKVLTKEQVKLASNDFIIQNKEKKSVRYTFNKILDEYDEYVNFNTYEQIALSTILIFEAYNLKPYSSHNDLMLIILMYYLLKKCDVKAFDYISFFELYLENEKEILNELSLGSVNYDQGVIFFSKLLKIILKMCLSAYKKFDQLCLDHYQSTRAFKSDNIEVTIMKNLPTIFSKDDIVTLYPEVSLSTIMRVLKRLQQKNYIMPLGKGRSAKWHKIVDTESYEYLVGGAKEDEN